MSIGIHSSPRAWTWRHDDSINLILSHNSMSSLLSFSHSSYDFMSSLLSFPCSANLRKRSTDLSSGDKRSSEFIFNTLWYFKWISNIGTNKGIMRTSKSIFQLIEWNQHDMRHLGHRVVTIPNVICTLRIKYISRVTSYIYFLWRDFRSHTN